MIRLFEPDDNLNKSWDKKVRVILLKPGDLNIQTLEIIELTRNMVITKGGLRFRRQDGTRVAGDKSDGFIKPFTPEVRAEFKRRLLIKKIKMTDFYSSSLDKLSRILQIIAEK